MNAPLIRPENCTKCKFREKDEAGVWRCHGGPPQRQILVTPQGPMLQVAWPEIPDQIAPVGWCKDFAVKILPATS